MIGVIDLIVSNQRPSSRVAERYSAMSRDGLRLVVRGSLPYSEAMYARFAFARVALEGWHLGEGRDELAQAVIATAEALLVLADARTARPGDKAAIVDAAALLTDSVAKPASFLRRLRARREQVQGVDRTSWLTAFGVAETDLRKIIRGLRSVLDPSPMEQLSVIGRGGATLPESTAALLLRGARDRAKPQLTTESPPSDLSQGKIRIAGVTLSNFRGVESALTVDFRRHGKPVSVLIFGDNGVGKSSLVDGIEFALQSRVGRSHDFDSAFAPALRNLNADTPATATVLLSDGSEVRRTLEQDERGRLRAVGPPPSSGFRWAPITLKRSDLLRFLDIDPLSRGAVFFDYFPGDAERMGMRPEERQALLQDELFVARVQRRTLATDLADRLHVPLKAVELPGALSNTLRDQLLGGRSLEKATQDGTWQEIDEDMRSLITALQQAMFACRKAKKGLDLAGNMLNPITYRQEATQLRKVMAEVGAELTTSFLSVTKADYVREIHVLVGETGPVSLDMVVELTNGEKVFPQQIFSEGYRDLLALLFFLAVARASAERGQAKVLALDDVIQSVDAGVRLGLMSHVLDHFADWQLILTIHDQLWYQQLRSLMQKRTHPFLEHRLIDWSFRGGPRISGATPHLLAGIDAALGAGDPALAAGAAGRLLELIASELSWRFRTSVQRTEGDRYTLHDLWPGVVKALRKSSVEQLAREVDDASVLRNVAGAHYNPYAESLSWGEAQAFAQSVRRLLSSLNCSQCGEWPARRGSEAACRCGNTKVTWH
ncbi:AAA family ATPase [Micromonospora ureilytica]|uniref:AAA family ATPase n=1 Tax=Micromonospora ureilytica TaxID=709868 RepID=UPI004039E95B